MEVLRAYDPNTSHTKFYITHYMMRYTFEKTQVTSLLKVLITFGTYFNMGTEMGGGVFFSW